MGLFLLSVPVLQDLGLIPILFRPGFSCSHPAQEAGLAARAGERAGEKDVEQDQEGQIKDRD